MMDEASKIYNELWDNSIDLFEKGEFELDPLVYDPLDTRRGVTVLARFDSSVTEKVSSFLAHALDVEPDLYCYSASDLHLTILSIITCDSGFKLDNICVKDYENVIAECARNNGPFKINFKGITASPSCILLQGTMLDDGLFNLRENLRKEFIASGLENTIDSRYSIQTAHSTIIRFVSPIKNSNELIRFLEKHREYDFGTMEVSQLEFVLNDWYQKHSIVQLLKKTQLTGFDAKL